MYFHLNPAQREALNRALATFTSKPPVSEYERIGKELATIKAPKPSQSLSIPHTRPGVHGSERWPSPLFIPDKDLKPSDLPAGLALTPIWDSANNHALHNAAVSAWRHLWNSWTSAPSKQLLSELELTYSH